MKICRILFENSPRFGVIENDFIELINSDFLNYSIKTDNDSDYLVGIKKTGEKTNYKNVKLLPPCTPTKIVAIGSNYKAHIKELNLDIKNAPVIFLKPPSALIGSGEGIVYPKHLKRVDYEAEIAVVIGKKCKNVKAEHAHKVVLGTTCLNDVSAREIQFFDGQWARAKGFDTFCPLGPYIDTEIDYKACSIEARLNGKTVQSSFAYDMLFGVDELIERITSVMTLEPFDVITTGTPSGIGAMNVGDKIEIIIDKKMILSNNVISD